MAKTNRRLHGEGSVIHRKDGRWVAVENLGVRGGKRDRRYFYGATPDEAIGKRELFRDRKRDGFVLPVGRPATVAEWMHYWLHSIAKDKVAATTWQGYRSYVEGRIIPRFERVPLPDLNEEMIETFHRELGKDLSPASITQIHRIMTRALKIAVVRGRIPRNACANVSAPGIERDEPQPPTAVELARIVERCATWDNGARWLLAIVTGARQGESLALQWSDVDLGEPASITIRRSAAWVSADAVDNGPVHVGRKRTRQRIVKTPKSRKSRRTIQIGATVVAALKAHQKTQVRNLAEDLVFTDPLGRPVHPTADYADWHALLDDLGIRHYRVHDLRHGAATSLLEAGLDVRVVQEILGHATPGFTQQAYQHVRPVLHKAAADAMEDIVRRR